MEHKMEHNDKATQARLRQVSQEPYNPTVALSALVREAKTGKKTSSLKKRLGKRKTFDKGRAPENPEGGLATAALRWAAKKGLAKLTKALIWLGAEIDGMDEKGYCALMWAVGCQEEGSYDTVAVLVDAGVDLDVDCMGWTPLMRASAMGHEKVCELFLEKGASHATRDPQGIDALMLACIFGRDLCVEALLEGGANPSARDSLGRAATHWAAARGSVECLQHLEPKIDQSLVDLPDTQGAKPADLAVQSNYFECARWLGSFGDRKKRQSLLVAADEGSVAGFGGARM